MSSIGRFIQITSNFYRRSDGIVVKSVAGDLTIQWEREDDDIFTAEDIAALYGIALPDVQGSMAVMPPDTSGLCFFVPGVSFLAQTFCDKGKIDYDKLLSYLDRYLSLRSSLKPKQDDLPGRLMLLEDTVKQLQETVKRLENGLNE